VWLDMEALSGPLRAAASYVSVTRLLYVLSCGNDGVAWRP
jgi:hypothetical protein